MKRLIGRTLILSLLASAALAAEPAPQPAYTISLTEPEIAYIGALLVRQPYGEVAGLIAKVQAQVSAAKNDASSKTPAKK